MVYNIYSIKDSKANTFSPITLHLNDDIAIRWLSTFLTVDDSVISQFPDDFSLYRLGTFNDTSGYIQECDPVLVKLVTEIK